MSVSKASQVLIAQSIGSQNYIKTKEQFQQGLYLSFLLTVPMILIIEAGD